MSVSGGRTLRGLNNLEENKCGRSVNSNEYFFPEFTRKKNSPAGPGV